MSTYAEIDTSYSVANDFFRLWLDESMAYTCGVWDGVSTLEEAQRQKHEILCDFAEVRPGMRVVDIGCGWGAALDHLVRVRGAAEAHGVTMSQAQVDEIEERSTPGVYASCLDYREYEPPVRFDAALTICMMEHIATTEQTRRGEHLGLYRDFFRRVHQWTKPGARWGLQAIIRDRVPRDRKDLEDVNWVTHNIFPGGQTFRLEDLVRVTGNYWEIMEIRTRREDYRRTTTEWARRLEANEEEIRDRWGDRVFDDYQRYLWVSARAFERRYQSLAQVRLRRIDETG